MKERLGKSHTCGGCGKVGRERLNDNPAPTNWACSANCAVKIMAAPERWGTIGWIKLP